MKKTSKVVLVLLLLMLSAGCKNHLAIGTDRNDGIMKVYIGWDTGGAAKAVRDMISNQD